MRSLAKKALGAGALAALLALPTFAQSPETLLPEDTLFYVGCNDVDGFLKTAKTKPLGRIMNEQEVQDFLKKPLGLLHAAVEEMVAEAKQHPAMKDFDIDPKKVMDGPYGRAFVALTHFTMPADKKGEPDVGLILGLEPKPGAMDLLQTMQQMIFSVADSEGTKLDSAAVQVGDLSYTRAVTPDGDGPPICFAKVGGLSVLSLSEVSMKDLLAQVSDSKNTLGSSADYNRCVAKCGAPSSGTPVMYAHVGKIMAMVSGIFDFVKEHEGDSEEVAIISVVQEMLDRSGLNSMGPVYVHSTWDGDVAVARSYAEYDPNAGFMSAFVGKPVDLSLLKLVPKNALSFTLAHADLAPLYDSVMGALKDASPELHGKAMAGIRMAEIQVAGADEDGNPVWDLRRDLIGSVGGGWFSMSTPGPATMFGPGGDWVAWMGCSNPQGLGKSIEHLIALPGQLAGFPLTFKETEHNGVKLHSLDTMSLGPMAMMAGGMEPSYAIHNGKLYMGSSGKALGKLLDSEKAPPEENITAKQDFARHWDKMDHETPVAQLTYSDTATNFESGYTQILGVIPMMMMGAPIDQDELPFEMALLPTAEVISQHLFGSVSASYQADTWAVGEMRGPFGAETGVAVACAAAGIGMVAVGGVWDKMGHTEEVAELEEWGEPQRAEPTEATRQHLRDLSAGITVYIVEFGAPPASLDELVKPHENYPKGILFQEALPTDAWGNGYLFQAQEDGSYTIWSKGANGEDEKGEGDDIKLAR